MRGKNRKTAQQGGFSLVGDHRVLVGRGHQQGLVAPIHAQDAEAFAAKIELL